MIFDILGSRSSEVQRVPAPDFTQILLSSFLWVARIGPGMEGMEPMYPGIKPIRWFCMIGFQIVVP